MFSTNTARRSCWISVCSFFIIIFLLFTIVTPVNVFAEDTASAQGWKNIGGNTYYYTIDGTMLTGHQIIKGKHYLFNYNGSLIKKKGLIAFDGKEYYGTKSGTLRTGWIAYKEKGKLRASYFLKKSGAMKKGGTVKHLEIPISGRLGRAYYYGIKVLNKNGWKMKKTFVYIARHTKYAHRSMRRKSIDAYAVYGFKKHKGNCYVMASQFYVTMKLLGKDVKQYAGTVGSRERAPHSWCVIKHKNGKKLIYDISFYNHFHHLRGFPSGYAMKEGTRMSYKYNKKDKKIIGK